MNNCTDQNGGWALGCRIDGGQAEYVRVPYAEQGLNKIPDSVTDEAALFVGDVLATRVLGGADFRDRRRGYGRHYRRRTYGNLYAFVRDA